MDLSRVRNAEWIAAGAGLLTLVAMFGFDWYERVALEAIGIGTGGKIEVGVKAWESQGFTGTIANLVILAAALTGIGLAVLSATSRTVALPVAASALCAQLGAAAVVMVILRMLFQPGPNEFTDLKGGIFIALIGTALITYGGWRSMEEEMAPYASAASPTPAVEASPEQSPLAQPPADDPTEARPPTVPPPAP
jgi:hypothetical protein